MKIHRIRLKDFGGVAAAEVEFATEGVTLVHGANETGKSTLMTGIDILFEFFDDSGHKSVRATKPVDRDVGAEVEADVEVGEYRFTYFKRFHKDRRTELKISAPRPETLSGRPAHERVQQILEGSVDTGLWKALRILQGGQPDLPQLHDQRALGDALDRAAGQARAGDRENALFDAAQGEYGQYYTDTGKEKALLTQLRSRSAEAQAAQLALQQRLSSLEQDVARVATLEKSRVTSAQSLAGLKAAAGQADLRLEQVSALEGEVARTDGEGRSAEHMLIAAREASEQRSALIAGVAATTRALEVASAEHERHSSAHEQVNAALHAARSERDAATAVADDCEASERLHRADLAFRTQAFELLRLRERQQHVAAADAAAVSARAVVAGTRLTEPLRAAIRDADVSRKTAQARLDQAAPKVTLTALAPVAVTVDGAATSVPVGAPIARAVTAPLSVRIDDLIEIHVDPGTSAEAQIEAVNAAERVFRAQCASAGVTDEQDAERAWIALIEGKRTITECDRTVREHLRDLDRDALARLISELQAQVAAYADRCNDLAAIPESVDACQAALARAGAAADGARQRRSTAQHRFDEAQERATVCRESLSGSKAMLDRARHDLESAGARLTEARSRIGDADLAEQLARAVADAITARQTQTRARQALAAADPEAARAMRDGAQAAVHSAGQQRSQDERDLYTLRGRLDSEGEAGLAEALDEATRVASEADGALQSELRRAEAARMLFQTLDIERQAMRRAYVAPLRERIESLGRVVFGESLRVEVDDGLKVTHRTLGGVTVLFDQLSTGAKEQMGLLVRLAAASMVSKEGGVPLVFDDALGATDQQRLEAMGAILRMVARDTQTIILTCSPERYAHVGARVVVGMVVAKVAGKVAGIG